VISELTADFAKAIEAVDAEHPVATSVRTKRAYQPGIGPHTETQTLALVRRRLSATEPATYGQIESDVPYLNAPRQKYDWLWTLPSGERVYIEAKMMRLMGHHGNPNDPFGRPPGFPLTPFGKGLPFPGMAVFLYSQRG
jgi:hypothetical protein